jgi:large subunit ribosomal protein L25
MLTVTAQNRAATESVAMLREQESIPAVVYGPQHAAQSISIPARAFSKVWREAGESTIIGITGLGKDVEVLIHEVQIHPLTTEALHVDFYAFDKNKKLTATIPLHFVGQSAAEKAGAIIIKVLHEITIEVLPAELPSHIDVDLRKLAAIDDHITVADLPLPPSAEAELGAEEIIATAVEAKEEVVSNLAPDVIPAVAEAQAAAAAAAAAKPADPDKKKSN